jgi:hypothetical protein
VSNITPIQPPYFGFLREMISRAETHSSLADDPMVYIDDGRELSNTLYEIEALTNVVGELECARAECERRIRYLQALAAEDI